MSNRLDRLGWQEALFAERLNRFQLMKLGARLLQNSPVLLVLRNHAFETAAVAMPPFLAFAGLELQSAYSDYDDSLALPAHEAAAVLVWMDFARLSGPDDADLAEWLVGRLDQVRSRSTGPLIVANSPDADERSERLNAVLARWAEAAPGAALLRLDEIARELGPAFFDPARAEATGTRYSDQAILQAARRLGLELLPGFLAPPVKAIAVDLDNTLYGGVLGEDGSAGVVLTPGHASLQAELAQWAARGVLLAVVSRNDPSDVERLFATREDFPLRSDMVADWQIGWGSKSASISAAAKAFNVASDSFLYIDDNAGELIEVAQAHPGLRLLFAGASAERTAAALARYPALPRGGPAFIGRAADVLANREREVLAGTAVDEEAYLSALQPVLMFALDPPADRPRLAELSAKTNQFNLALRRFDEVEVERYLKASDRAVVHVRLSDRLADSGSVAAVFMRRDGEVLVVDELCISCRALGRKLEGLIVSEAVRRGAEVLSTTKIDFTFAHGPRNAPALAWLKEGLALELIQSDGRVPAGAELPRCRPNDAIEVIWTS